MQSTAKLFIQDSALHFIEDLISEWHSSDIILGVVKKNHETGEYQDEYATFGLNAHSYTENTLFPIASNSKQFTALAIGFLIADEKTCKHFPQAWRTPLKDLFPDFRLMDPVATDLITLEDALSHRSGLPRHDYMFGDFHGGGFAVGSDKRR